MRMRKGSNIFCNGRTLHYEALDSITRSKQVKVFSHIHPKSNIAYE